MSFEKLRKCLNLKSFSLEIKINFEVHNISTISTTVLWHQFLKVVHNFVNKPSGNTLTPRRWKLQLPVVKKIKWEAIGKENAQDLEIGIAGIGNVSRIDFIC